MAKPAIVLEEIRKSYPDARTGKPNLVLNDISFRADLGAVTVVMGQSGSGKSTLFQVLIGERRPDSGKISILGHQLDPTDPRSFDAVKTSFGILFQHGALFNAMTVHENIIFPIIEHRPQLSRDTVDEMAWIKLRQVRLNPDIFSLKKPPKLSGGERKRVALARALALDPKLVFYDEPSADSIPSSAERSTTSSRSWSRSIAWPLWWSPTSWTARSPSPTA